MWSSYIFRVQISSHYLRARNYKLFHWETPYMSNSTSTESCNKASWVFLLRARSDADTQKGEICMRFPGQAVKGHMLWYEISMGTFSTKLLSPKCSIQKLKLGSLLIYRYTSCRSTLIIDEITTHRIRRIETTSLSLSNIVSFKHNKFTQLIANNWNVFVWTVFRGAVSNNWW